MRARFDGGYGPFPPALVDRASWLFAELMDPAVPPELIHGDLHTQNILQSQRDGWLAIDPKGVVGDRLYDAAVFANDLHESSNRMEMKTRLARRVAHLADLLQVDRRQILDWAFAQAVLSGWWSYEDHGRGWERAFSQAEINLELQGR
jgi:streptomycin 6-kinase